MVSVLQPCQKGARSDTLFDGQVSSRKAVKPRLSSCILCTGCHEPWFAWLLAALYGVLVARLSRLKTTINTVVVTVGC